MFAPLKARPAPLPEGGRLFPPHATRTRGASAPAAGAKRAPLRPPGPRARGLGRDPRLPPPLPRRLEGREKRAGGRALPPTHTHTHTRPPRRYRNSPAGTGSRSPSPPQRAPLSPIYELGRASWRLAEGEREPAVPPLPPPAPQPPPSLPLCARLGARRRRGCSTRSRSSSLAPPRLPPPLRARALRGDGARAPPPPPGANGWAPEGARAPLPLPLPRPPGPRPPGSVRVREAASVRERVSVCARERERACVGEAGRGAGVRRESRCV